MPGVPASAAFIPTRLTSALASVSRIILRDAARKPVARMVKSWLNRGNQGKGRDSSSACAIPGIDHFVN